MSYYEATTILITTLFSIVSFFVVRTLRQIDKNQLELFHRLRDLEMHFTKLQAEHNLMMCKLRKED